MKDENVQLSYFTADYCMTPRSSKEEEDVQHRVTSHTHDRHTHTDHTHRPHTVTYSTLSEDQHVRMVNDFELMYEEKQLEQSIEGTSSLGGVSDHMTQSHSSEDTCDHIADDTRHADEEVVTNNSSVHSTEELMTDVKGKLADVEEGEVADSGDETTSRQNNNDQVCVC